MDATTDLNPGAWMATSRQGLPKHSHVTAMTATNDLALLGTRAGQILCYQIEYGLLRLCRSLTAISKRLGPITQLIVIESIHVILALSEGVIHIFSLLKGDYLGVLTVHENGVPVTSAVKLITRPVFGSTEIIIATRRQLTFCEYDCASRTFRPLKKALFVPGAPVSLSWICGKLCVGFEMEFTLVDLESGDVDSLWLFESGPAFSISVNSAHTILSSRKNAISFSFRPDGLCIHSRVNWGEHRSPIAICVQDSLLFVSFKDHIGVFTVDDISHPIGRIDLVNISILLSVTDVIVAGNSETIFILRRMTKEVLQRDVFFLDKLSSISGTERELHLKIFFEISLEVNSKHPYALTIDAFIQNQLLTTSEDPVPVCRRIRMFIDSLSGCIFDDLLANGIPLLEMHQQMVRQCISLSLFRGNFFDSLFGRFIATTKDNDSKLSESYKKLRDTSLQQLGSSIKIEDPASFFDSPISLLRTLSKLRSPFEMLNLLCENLSKKIYKIIQEAGSECGVEELTADEYIPILVFIVIHAGVDHLQSYVSFMTAFISKAESRGHVGYVLTTMTICLEHISNLVTARQYSRIQRSFSVEIINSILEERVAITE